MVADAGAKARQYRERRAALAATRPVRFVYVPDGSEPPASAYAVKRISFIRHGQGEHNLHDEQWTAANKPGNPYGPDKLAELPHLVDPALTAKGVEQARALQSAASAMHPAPELIVVSPMRRAVDTALLAFAHVFDDPAVAHAVPVRRSDLRPAVSIVGHELCRESYARSEKTPVQTPQPQGNICDKRRPLEQIAADYPYIDWALVNDGPTDVVYERGGEDMDSFVERGFRFMLWLGAREETRIVVACHSGFLLNVFNSAIEFPSQGVADSREQSWFETGEMRTLSIAVLGNPHPWAPQPVTPTSTLSHAAAPEGSMLGAVGIGPIYWMLLSGALAMAAFRRVRKFRS